LIIRIARSETMDEAWYIVEQQIRGRLTEARKAARIRALTHDRTSTPRRMSSVRTTIIRLAKWALGLRMRAGRRADVSDNGRWLGRWRVAVSYAFVALLVGSCAPQSDRAVVTHEGRRQRDVVLDIDGPPGWSVEISEFVFESGPVSSRVKGRAIVTAEGPPDLMSTTGYLDIRSGERSAIYRLVGRMSRMKGGRTVLDCTGFRETDAAEFPLNTWIRLTVDETTAVAYVQRTRLPSEGQ
jgi:hypothetical protein